MSKVILTGQGDNNYRHEFESEERAWWFIYGLLSQMDRYFKEEDGGYFAFDIEDDCITWLQDGKKRYCAGWHWMDRQDEPSIELPDGRNLYRLFTQITNEG